MKRSPQSGPDLNGAPVTARPSTRRVAPRNDTAGARSDDATRSAAARSSTRADRDARAADRRTLAAEWADAAPRRPRPVPAGAPGGAPAGRRGARDDRASRIDTESPRRTGSGRGPEDTRPPSLPDRDEVRGRRPGPASYARTPVGSRPAPQPGNAAKSVRGRRKRPLRQAPGRPDNRIKVVLVALLVMLVVAVIKLTFIQGWTSTAYAAKAFDQRTRVSNIVAERGTINDRNGTPLAFTVAGKAIAGRPYLLVSDAERQQVVDALVAAFGTRVDPADLMEKLTSDDEYVYLVRGLTPAEADKAMDVITPILLSYKKELPARYAGREIDGVVTEPQPSA